MSDWDCYDAMRIKAMLLASQAACSLDAANTTHSQLAPHVVQEKIIKLRQIARQINALVDFVEALP